MEPKFIEYMKPVLCIMADGTTRKNSEIHKRVVDYMKLDEADLVEKQSDGRLKYKNNINWACSYLFMAGCLNRKGMGEYYITDLGLSIYKSNPLTIDTKYLEENCPGFIEKLHSNRKKKYETETQTEHVENENIESLNPEEQMEDAENLAKETIKSNLRSMLINSSPVFFEKVCKDLLLAMGYGYDNAASGKVTQYIKDGGIDGIIYSDKLGLEKIYLQAKKYAVDNTVGRPSVAQFVGDIGSSKGVFLTTSKFSKDAIEYAEHHKNIVLIDGDKIVNLMYENGVGVSIKRTYCIKNIDTDYFEE